MRTRHFNIRLALSAFILGLILYSCGEDDRPECGLVVEGVVAPEAFRLETEPFIDLMVNEKRYVLLQDQLFGDILTEDVSLCPGLDCNQVNTHRFQKFFQLNIMRPNAIEELFSSVGITTPILTLDSLLNRETRTVHFGLSLIDNCNVTIEATGESNNYNRIDRVEMVDTIPTGLPNLVIYETLVTGELKADFDISGEMISVMGNYKMTVYLDQSN